MILSPLLKFREFDANGIPLIGGQLFSYIAGTTTPQATYTDQSGGTPNTNPVVLDSTGRASVWLDPTLAYKFVLQDSLGNVIYTVDQVSAGGSSGIAGWSANTTYQEGNIVADSSGAGLLYVSLTNNNIGNALSSTANWRLFEGNIRTLSSNTTLVVTDEFIRSNSTGASLTHTLPSCASTPIGKRIVVKDIGTGSNSTSIKGSGTDLVDGNNTYALALPSEASVTVENNGSSWDVITSHAILLAGSVGTTQLTTGAVTQAKLAARATGSTVAAGGVAISSSSGTFSTTSNALVAVTNLSVTITTTGRPVFITLLPDGTSNSSLIEVNNSSSGPGTGLFAVFRGATNIANTAMEGGAGTSSFVLVLPPGAISFIDAIAAGTYTYTIQAKISGPSGTGLSVLYSTLAAYEM